MGGRVVSARAYANNEVVYIAWAVDTAISGCRGFDVRRIDVTSGQEQSLPAWVPFQGQSNTGWQNKTTAIWPVQRLSWKDLTWRDELDKQIGPPTPRTNPPIDRLLKYRIVPMLGPASSLQPREDLAAVTNPVHLTLNFGDISVAFNNGILSTQWLTNQLKQDYGTGKPLDEIKAAINLEGNPIRVKLAGDTLPFLRRLLERAQAEDGSVVLALYELTDAELIGLLLQNKDRIKIILSNTSSDKSKKVWDTENEPARLKLHAAGVQIQDRMFNNDHIGHNKFAVLLDKQGQPVTVLTGSTNWTANGMCAQSNNAALIDSSDLAAAYYAYWKRVLDDKLPIPNPITAPTKNVQGGTLRRADMTSVKVTLDSGKTAVQAWFSPNTAAGEKNANSPVPPDLAQLYALMRNAKKAIFFLVFLPGAHGNQSIIDEAIKMGDEDPSLLVLGAVSNSLAMPIKEGASLPPAKQTHTYVVNTKRHPTRASDIKATKSAKATEAGEAAKSVKPAAASKSKGNGGGVSPVFAQHATEIVQAAALKPGDLVGAFQAELLSAGNAIIHDKIVVIDPLSDNPVVAFGSHNLGYKASYGNDENLLIVQGNQALALAYAVHVLDIYDHYRFRAEQQEHSTSAGDATPAPAARSKKSRAKAAGAKTAATAPTTTAASTGGGFNGFLQDNDTWQQDYIEGKRGTDAGYFAKG